MRPLSVRPPERFTFHQVQNRYKTVLLFLVVYVNNAQEMCANTVCCDYTIYLYLFEAFVLILKIFKNLPFF